ncbi:MAG: hypothetical protein AUI08_12600 [Gemmatimonadetes bacterium 13_2_20CM_2_65_7]|nr:MAG: hypothetical protein AUI08_12600 [Gemmatimonadetes bacterium 13_2_20CM_2_65_7]
MNTFRVGSLRSFLALLPIGFGACNSGGMVGSVDRSGTWSVVSVPTTDGLTNVRGSNSTNVWVAGDTTILRWDGHTWNRAPDPLPSTPAAGLWVNSSSDVWLGAGQKFAYHWMGSAWTSTSLNDNRTASAIWGSGPTDVWASDCASRYLGHYDGSVWTRREDPIHVPSPAPRHLGQRYERHLGRRGLRNHRPLRRERVVASSHFADKGPATWNLGNGGK